MTLKKKLLAGFLTCTAILLFVGAIGIFGIEKLNSSLDAVSKNRLPSIDNLGVINEAQAAVKAACRSLLIPDLAADRVENQRKYIAQAFERADAAWKVYEPLEQTPEEAVLWKKFVGEWERWKNDVRTFTAMSEAYRKKGSKEDYAKALKFELTTATASFRAAEETLGKIIDLNGKIAQQERMSGDKTASSARITLVLALILGALAAVTLALLITRGILRQLGGDPTEVSDIATKVAGGDLAVHVAVADGDTRSVMAAMNSMVLSLRELISETVSISSGIAAASAQLHATSEQIATAAEEVASQTSTVATASEEMSATSLDIARNCTFAAENSKKTSDSADFGASIVQETISGMEKIADRVMQTAMTIGTLGTRSEQIGEIIGTIEDIADQTNLLALNAAIEAARAGEQGRGFAVVADEVRALAERTTKATREISEMIKSIQSETKAAVRAMEEGVNEVEKGASSSMKSGEALQEILSQIGEVTMQINQIATASEEQTATTTEITSNIQQITDVIHQSANGAEETSAAAAQLAEQAQYLQDLVGKFRIA
ncbi:MAG TPA: methyl-accepting chemotaxis protein [Geobacteraceae bacterium]|nr:methyl-accepting chemotaxis protein [Geobacteraceae bacterium]